MPNPLSMAMSTPTAAVKPDANARDQRDPNAAASFQSVMDEENGQQPAGPEVADPPLQELEAEPEVEETTEDVETADIAVALEDHPLPETRNVSEEPALTPAARTSTEHPSFVQVPVKLDEQATAADQLDSSKAEIPASQQSTVQQAGHTVVQTLRWGDGMRANTALKPQNDNSVPATAEARPKDVPNLTASFGSGRDISHDPPASAPPPKRPTGPEQAPTLVQMQLLATEQTSDDADTASDQEIEGLQTTRDTAGSSSTRETAAGTHAMTATARAETARAIAGQMISAINTRPQSGAIEIALNPEELGRVSIVLNGRDDGFHLTIAAERPETMDLMRRHLSVLEAEFKNLGLGDLTFDLGTSSDAEQDHPNTEDGSPQTSHLPENTTDSEPDLPKIRADGRIDIRL